MAAKSPRLIRPTRSMRPILERVFDGCMIALALTVPYAWHSPPATEWTLIGFTWALYLVVGELLGLYRDWRGASRDRSWSRATMAWAVVALAFLVLSTASPLFSQFLAGSPSWTWFGVVPPLALAGYRILLNLALRELYRHGWRTRSAAIFGANSLGLQLAESIASRPESGMRIVGFYDDRPADRTEEIPKQLGQRRGGVEELLEDTRNGRAQVIYITLPMRAESRIQRDLLDRLSDTTASVYVVPDFFVFELLHGRWTDVGGMPAVSIFESPIYGVDGLVKRVMDIVGALVALAIFSLPMIAIALAIKLTSKGPVFFRQRRYGLDGREINVWKFRTMTVCEDGDQVRQATKNDSRVTPLGRILRRTSLDELPQLFNVLWGDMSLVGPRPHANAHNEEYRKLILGYMLRHKVKPGITGLAQVNGFRGETDTLEKMEQRLKYDREYIRSWSIWLDIKILFKTLWIVWGQPNAY